MKKYETNINETKIICIFDEKSELLEEKILKMFVDYIENERNITN